MKSLRLVIAVTAGLHAASLLSAAPDWHGVDTALGRPGSEQADGVHRYSFPRSDLRVTLDGVQLRPALALGSWLAFQPHGNQAMVMGDLVLLETEVNPVMTRLLADGIAVTALHNHLLRSSPTTIYMHIEGQGDSARLAAAIRSALALTGTPLGAPAAPAAAQPLDLDTAALDRLIGAAGRANGGVYQFSLPRRGTITEAGMPVPPSMGLAIAINFQPTGAGHAVATGDFVLTAAEVDPVMRALRAAGIDVTALHNHLGHEQPRLFFMHFWGNEDAAALAAGLRRALDLTAASPAHSFRR